MRWSRQHLVEGIEATTRVRLEAAGFAVRLFGRGETAVAETNYCSSKENAFARAELVVQNRYPSHSCHDGCTDWAEELEAGDPPSPLSPGGR